jgi:aminocarboxymuconate-semialdehyde decarboxylase
MHYLMSIVGPDRVMFGTDWPHQVFDTPGAMKHTAELPADQSKLIRSATAIKVFNL